MADEHDEDTNEVGKLGEVPRSGAPVKRLAAFLARGYGLPGGYEVSRVVRMGGRTATGLTVFISPPGGAEIRIAYDRESDCTNHVKLRAQAAADTKGLTRASRISSPKAALAMYEVLCSMAENFELADRRGDTWEWIQQLHKIAATTSGTISSYRSLRRLQEHEYSKRAVQTVLTDKFGQPLIDEESGLPRRAAIPLLLFDIETGYTYATARHMAVFLRYDLGVEDAGSDDRILTRLIEIGGARVLAEQWDSTGRDRKHKVRLVLYRLPEEAPDEGDGT
jgi:hypothetical protein